MSADEHQSEPLVSDGSCEQTEQQTAEHGFRDLGLGVVLLGSAAVLAYSAATDTEMHQDFGLDPGPAFLANILIWLLGIGAVILILHGCLLLMRAGWRVPSPIVDIKRSNVPVLLVASIILYVMLVPVIGFLAISLLFAVVWSTALAVQDHGLTARPLVVSAIGSAIIAIGIYLTFKQLIGIPLG